MLFVGTTRSIATNQVFSITGSLTASYQVVLTKTHSRKVWDQAKKLGLFCTTGFFSVSLGPLNWITNGFG